MFLDIVGRRAGLSQNGGTDDTKEGDVHEEVGSVSYDWGIIERERTSAEEHEFDRLRAWMNSLDMY